MKRTKIFALIMALVMCLAFSGCDLSLYDLDYDFYDDSGSGGENLIIGESESDPVVSQPDITDESVVSEPVVSEPAEEGSSTPLLYKVTDSKGNVVWLFGSIHVGREDFYPLPDYVLDAYKNSDALAVEVDIIAFEKDFAAQMTAMQELIFTDGSKIKDYISDETYNKAVEILEENNLYNFAMDYYKPSLWSNFIDNCAYMQLDVDMEGGIDRYLLEDAKKSGKKILEVESAALQYGVLGGFSDELQVLLLESSIEAYGDLKAMDDDLNEMMDLWAKGDEKEFSEYLSAEGEFEDEEEERLYNEYNQALLIDRNKGMIDYAEKALLSGEEVFICVGAAHVVGEGGMAEELAALGYTVEIVR